jgi:hypothetical protein
VDSGLGSTRPRIFHPALIVGPHKSSHDFDQGFTHPTRAGSSVLIVLCTGTAARVVLIRVSLPLL